MVSINSALLASVLSVAAASDLGDAFNAVAHDASSLSSVVNGWSSQQGLVAALNIQNGYYPLSSAVSSLNSVANSATKDDAAANSDEILSVTSNVANLLDALTAKAADFQSVGAFSIVTSDINGLSTPAAEIVSKILAVNNDEAFLAPLKDNVNGFADAFTTAISAFKASAVAFPRL